ncbi:HAD family hydrolase [Streptomyces sp. NPDC089799]|uniref:HAD family hydrolase n=1 Tax=Streptomyces sp. NPDC089799 TaxID=3155066 RepID=UPI003429BD64
MRAIVFDMDGTLLDSVPTVSRADADAIRSLGGPPVSPDEMVAEWHVGHTELVPAGSLGVHARWGARAGVRGSAHLVAAHPYDVLNLLVAPRRRMGDGIGAKATLRLRPAGRQISCAHATEEGQP